MNSLIEFLNTHATGLMDFAVVMIWQSSILITIVFAFEWLLRRRIRAAIRYALWLVVLVKLLVPPTLALPTGAAWWLRIHKAQPGAVHGATLVATMDEPAATFVPEVPVLTPVTPPRPKLSGAGGMLI